MGYDMTYSRVIRRNGLDGGYDGPGEGDKPWDDARAAKKLRRDVNDDVHRRFNMIAGDLRRLEADQRDPLHLAQYAEAGGVTPEQAKTMLDLFFTQW